MTGAAPSLINIKAFSAEDIVHLGEILWFSEFLDWKLRRRGRSGIGRCWCLGRIRRELRRDSIDDVVCKRVGGLQVWNLMKSGLYCMCRVRMVIIVGTSTKSLAVPFTHLGILCATSSGAFLAARTTAYMDRQCHRSL